MSFVDSCDAEYMDRWTKLVDVFVHQLKIACCGEILKHLLETKLMEELLIAKVLRIVFLYGFLRDDIFCPVSILELGMLFQ
jgi:hypothetical protein